MLLEQFSDFSLKKERKGDRLRRTVSLLKNFDRVATLFNAIGMCFFIVIVLLIVVDVVLRYFFSLPVTGSLEIIEFMLVLLVFFGIAYAQIFKGHVAIDLIVCRLQDKVQIFIHIVITAVSLGLFFLFVWRSLAQFHRYNEIGTISKILSVPISPFLLIIAFGSLLMCIILLRELLESLELGQRMRFGFPVWIGMLALVGLLPFAVIYLDRIPLKMDPLTTGILGILFLFILLFSRMPVAFGLALVGVIGLGYLRNMGIGLGFLGTIPFRTTASFTFCVIPLFVLMGTFCFYSEMSRDLYTSAYSWIGHMPGGISMATVAGCAGFAALCGDSLTTSVTMGTVGIPEMKRYKYDPALATGSVAAGGTIGILIPPSIGFIIYGLLTSQSIGALFIAGIIPGILLTVMFLIYIYLRCRSNPNMGPPGPPIPFKERLLSLKRTWPMIFLFVLVIGGIYGGFFTPTEAGAIGAFGALTVGVVRGRFTWKRFYESLLDAGKITSMVFMILIGADLFSYFLAVSKLPFELAGFVAGLPLPRVATLIIILFIYLLLGCLMPAIAMIILTLPIFFPIVKALEYDPVWFGVIMVLMLELAVITPPIGINVFAVSGIAKDVPMSTIFRGIFPFFLVMVVCIVILIAFPQIATFLPRLLGFSW